MILLIHQSSSYELDKDDISQDQLVQYALGEVLQGVGLRFQLAAQKNEIRIPDNIRVEIIVQGWDLQVRLHLEKNQ